MAFFQISDKIKDLSEKAMELSSGSFAEIESNTEYNQLKMLSAFVQNGVSESHFVTSTGYGYDDRGREVLEKVFAQAFGAEDALVRHTFTCGTHTLATALFGVLRPGDTMLCVTGTPYDTIHSVIGLSGSGMGSLKEFGVNYEQVDLLPNGEPDFEGIKNAVHSKVKMVYIQRSRGYSLRPSFSVETIGKIADTVKKVRRDVIVMVDNCYGEFVQRAEPLEFGADLIAGSLIKNPGGGIAPTGGYIAGRRDLVELCSYRMTTPGLGREVGATLGQNRELFMGIYHAPHVVGEALKTAAFASALFKLLGYGVTPDVNEKRCDIIQAIQLREEPALIAFCQGLQKGAPVDAFVRPDPAPMPGYDSDVIMSAGAFTLGSSIELSADAPLREPYAVWLQGGLNFYASKIGIQLAAQEMLDRGILDE